MNQETSDTRSPRRPALRAGGAILAVACTVMVVWAMHRPALGVKASPLSETSAAAAGTAKPAAAPGQAPSKAQTTAPSGAAASASNAAAAKKQLSRVDLVIDHVADMRGYIEPCG